MRRSPAGGFTLLEIMVAITVLTVVVMFIYEVLQNSVRGQSMVRDGLRVPKIQNAILGQVMKDFRYLYWDGFTGNTGFYGKLHSVGGMEASSVNFVTARPSRAVQPEDRNIRDSVPSPLTEVGYALRINDENGEFIELWRREDWFVDEDPVKGGKYTLVYDKIKMFKLQYFPIPEENVSGDPVDEWDSRIKNKLPYAVVLDVRFEVDEEPPPGRDREDAAERLRRTILVKSAYNVAYDQTPAPTEPGGQPPAPER